MLVKPTTVNFLRLFAVCGRPRNFLRLLADRILNFLRLELLAEKAQFNFFLPLACSCGARTTEYASYRFQPSWVSGDNKLSLRKQHLKIHCIICTIPVLVITKRISSISHIHPVNSFFSDFIFKPSYIFTKNYNLQKVASLMIISTQGLAKGRVILVPRDLSKGVYKGESMKEIIWFRVVMTFVLFGDS